MPNPTCTTCIHWQPRSRATDYSAPCALSYQRTRYDETCDKHALPTPDMQSRVRGGIPWVWMGGKP